MLVPWLDWTGVMFSRAETKLPKLGKRCPRATVGHAAPTYRWSFVQSCEITLYLVVLTPTDERRR